MVNNPFAGPLPSIRNCSPDISTAPIIAGISVTVIENSWVESGAVPLLAVIAPLNGPASEGTPETSPAGLISMPVGSPLAVKVMGAVPLAVQVCE